MSRSYIKILLAAVLFVFGHWANGQYSTDNRVIFEHMRYSAEKPFNTWSVSLGYGPLIMYNDLANYKVFPMHWKFGPNITVAKQLVPAWAFDLQFLSGDFVAGGSTFYSEGNIMEFSLNSQTYINQLLLLPGPLNDKWNFYFKLGFGLTAFRTRVRYNDTDEFVHFGDFGEANEEDGYIVLGYDKDDPTKKIARAKEFVVPIGAGVQYRLNRSFDLAFETSMRLSLEDKLDNILVGAQNDKYWSTSISICYKIGKKDKRHSRWTYRGYGFNVFGAPKNDPLQNEIRVLEEDFKKYQEGRVVKKDSITVIHSAQKVYGTANLVTVFFELEKYNEVDNESLVELATLALNMTKNKSWKADIYGYSDEYDKSENNIEISRKRCERILQFFVRDLGLERERFVIHPLGEEDILPQDITSKKARLSINRRVDVVLKK
ncbi:OmpA family protein [Carboxylicivirga linearis]|uniref:Flagellar motor protein MotB n=1 Tax=Carboxylicivirga linearis TaxID=1628157 RepID=A0ABS5JQH0_9BACT|nr:flagellar motor protein MotB [Carboxylicivirga linearis]MBS2097114.1 flagellar motor protein MotB [Carboxylicivirga linearis]